MQQRTTIQQSAEHFGPFATSAVGALALGFKSGDLFAPTVTHGLPLLQLLLASRGGAMTSSFRANPWSTLGFPALALFLTAFRESIPGLRPTVVDQPDVLITPETGNKLLVTARKAKGTVLRFTGPASSPSDPDSNSQEFPGVVRPGAGEMLKIRAFIGTGRQRRGDSGPRRPGHQGSDAARGSRGSSPPRTAPARRRSDDVEAIIRFD